MARPRTVSKPAAKAAPAKPKTKPTANKPKWTKEQLVYLAGVWSCSLGLKGPSGDYAVVIAPHSYPEWPQHLADTYGGEAKEFVSRGGTVWNGWYVSNELKLEFLDAMEKAQVMVGIPTGWRDTCRMKLNKALAKTTKK